MTRVCIFAIEKHKRIIMKTYYHGTSKLFKEFRPLDTIGTGEGKSKFGWGIYLTSAYATAVLYSGKGPGREAPDHYIYSVEIPDTETDIDKYFVLHQPVPQSLVELVEKEIGQLADPEVAAWGNDFRNELENMLFVREFGHKPKGKEEKGMAQKLAADWLYAHGIIGLIWPQGGWPKKGEEKPVEKFNIAMFNSKDTQICKIERVDVEFKAKSTKEPDNVTCIEKKDGERVAIDINCIQ